MEISSRNLARSCRGLGVGEKMRVLAFHLIFPFPCEFVTTTRVPPNLHDRYSAVSELFEFTIHDLNGFLDEAKFFIDLNFLSGNDHGFVRQTFLKITNVKSVVDSA